MKPFFYTLVFLTGATQEVVAQCRARDSLILVDLYNATNGANWSIRWTLAQPINTWSGIKLTTGGCVDSISLSARGITGRIPIRFRQLDSLRSLSIASNKIDSLPNLSNLTRLQTIFAANNKLTFDDILPNLADLQRGTYIPQDSLFARDSILNRYIGDAFSIDLGIDGAIPNNVYTWFKDGTVYRTTTQNRLVFSSLQVANGGLYACTVTNPAIPSFILYTRRILLGVKSCYLSDSAALVRLYNATNQGRWKDSTNWLKPFPIGSWYGITVNANGCVDEISLPNNQLTGNLTFNAGDFPQMTTLALPNNQLTGSFPANLPTLSNLRNLYLFKNKFSGNLPNNLSSLTQLRQLDLSENQFTGLIPANIGTLTNLQLVHLDSNRLTGAVPATINNLTQLWRFSAFKNQLDSLPNLTLTQLTAFNVSENKLTFDDVLPNVSRSLNYANQATIFNDVTYQRFAGDTLTIDLGKDKGVASNVYQWYQDGKFYTSTNSNKLIFNALQTNRTGIYTCVVTNPDAPNLVLYSAQATLLVTPITKTLNIQLCQGDSHRLPKGRIVKITGIYSDTLRSWLNSDSIVITNLNVNPKYQIQLPTQIVCNSRDTMTIVQNFSSVKGCDSVVIQPFRLVKSNEVIEDRLVCDTLLEGIDTVRLKNQNGCDSLVIRHGIFFNCLCLKQTRIYNALIPNDSDNKNNIFIIDYLERYTPNELIITDRRGMTVFKTQNYKNDWSGTNQNGAPLPAGIYNFVFRTTHPITNQSCMRMGAIDIKYIP